MIPRALFREYVALLHRRGLLQQVLRLDEDQTELFGEQWMSSSAADLEGGIDYLSLGTLHPDWFPIRRACEEVERGMRECGFDGPERALVALFPTSSFNAQSRVSEAGLLVLVDKGLVRLLRSASKTALASFRVGDELPLIGGDQAAAAVAGAIWDYLFDDGPGAEAPLVAGLDTLDIFGTRGPGSGQPADRRALLAAGLTEACLRFAIAHEYGHFAAGHLHPGRQVSHRLPSGDLELVEKRHAEEFEADGLGARVQAYGVHYADGGQELEDQVALVTAGPLFFLALDDLLVSIGEQLGPRFSRRTTRDHPPSAERRARLRAVAEGQLAGMGAPAGLMDLADAVERLWLPSIEPAVIELLRGAEAPGS